MRSSNRPAWIAAAILVLGGAVAAAVYLRSRDNLEAAPPYTIAKVVRGDIVRSVNTTGQLTPLINVEVSSQISGLVTEVNVDFNSEVRKGQILARIDASTYEQRLLQAQADLAAAEATHTLTKLNSRRLHDLREQDLVTQAEFDESEALLQQSRAVLLTRKAVVENARVELQRCTITSPIDGIVIYKQVEVGKTVVSSFNAPTLFVIAQDLTKMRIIAPISEVDVSTVNPGQAVTFTVDALPGRTFTGRLTQIRNPYTPNDKQQQSGGAPPPSQITSFDGVIEVDNPDLSLRPSLTANVSVITYRRQNVLSIPSSALRITPPENAVPARAPVGGSGNAVAAEPAEADAGPDNVVATVYRLPGGDRSAIPEAVAVRVGVTDNFSTQILTGLREGESVITGIANSWNTPKRRSLL